uniref:Trifunctional purine biosynthetic protein adenosine-3 n=1 Tax=Homalodisca liturata TaxID=320908 RepID=A0A1B6JBE3_9HEMI
MSANVLVIGGGGREHAICWKLAMSPKVKKVYAAPGNVGIGGMPKAENVDLNLKDFKAVAEWCIREDVSLVVVGPEDPLANGIADTLVAAGIKCFGPSKLAARIEAYKDWAKEFMKRHDIPTARWETFTDFSKAKESIYRNDNPQLSYDMLVVKATGLAAGKGVVVAESRDEVCAAVEEALVNNKFGTAGNTVIVEERLEGQEVSVLGFCDGRTVKAMVPAQDHKRALNGDLGPNTGGMGAYAPCLLLSPRALKSVEENILQRAVKGLSEEGCPFVGVLYAGLMMTRTGPKVLEFNCRFGDPETEVLLPLLESDLYEIMLACCEGRLEEQNIEWEKNMSVVAVIMASKGYPESSSKGDIIEGVKEVLESPGTQVFHCGTGMVDGKLVTAGGRVLAVVSQSESLSMTATLATAACQRIHFPGAQFRTDIAHKGIPRWILKRGKLTYKASGVDITAGDALVSTIKPAVAATSRAGVMGQLGGFAAAFDLKEAGYEDPILVSGTDGVGTKLKIAQECGQYSSLGQDLVAMCVNDVLCQGAAPLFFLDYFACGHLAVNVAGEFINGVAEACNIAGCSLVGGETAEMPGLYKDGDFDVAGFAVGAVERKHLLPRVSEISAGDVVIGVPSSGLHSNGFSLVRRVMDLHGLSYNSPSPFSDKTLGEELLTPTKIYVKDVMPFIDKVKAIAHITGGGLVENIPRVLPSDVSVRLDASHWPLPPVFGWLAVAGGVGKKELLRTFNCGIGLVLIVAQKYVEDVRCGIPNALVIGNVKKRNEDEPQVIVKKFGELFETPMLPHVSSHVTQLSARKRVAVLISGSGTNLQALIEATAGNASVAMGAHIVLVISNKPDVKGLKRAQKADIKTEVIKHTDYPSRLEFDQAIHECLVAHKVDIVCLAGFMRVLTGEFVRKWRGRMINIHPALLPLFKGTHAHRQALEAGVRVTGCSVHFVEEDIDNGAIIAQKAVDILQGDTEDSLSERVKLAEHAIYPQALKLLATGKIHLDENTNKIVWN